MDKNEKLVFESSDEVVNENVSVENDRVSDSYDDENVPMSNGENCGIVEFEGKRINTCKGEKIVQDGYVNPDNK